MMSIRILILTLILMVILTLILMFILAMILHSTIIILIVTPIQVGTDDDPDSGPAPYPHSVPLVLTLS